MKPKQFNPSFHPSTMTGESKRPTWQTALGLLAFFALWLIATGAHACKLEETWRYTVNLEGTNQLRMKMPLYDKEGSDCWVEEGTVYIKIEGKEKDILFHYYSEEDIPKNDYYPYVFL